MDIGKRIKELRSQYGLTQQELADRLELTKGFISQLERNQNSPSVSTLLDIIQCLGVTPAEFFTDEEPEQIVFKSGDYFEKADDEKNSLIEWIIPNAQKNEMEPIRLTLEPYGSIYPDLPHEGEEFGYVLSGQVKIHLGQKVHQAKKGDAFYFTPSKKHYLEAGKHGAVVIWVTSPPSF